MTEPAPYRSNGAERYSVAMVAACPFPANHGSAASIREMSDTLSQMGHAVHIVTYPTGQEDIVVRHAKIHRTGPFRPETNAKVGPSPEKFLRDFALLRLLCRVIQRERIEVIHAHNYEGALIGVMAKWITGRPLLYNAVNLMSDELAGYSFIRPVWLAQWLARALDWLIPIFPDHITAVSPELKQWLVDRGIREQKVDMIPAGIQPELFDNAGLEKIRARHGIERRPIVMYTGVLNAFLRTVASSAQGFQLFWHASHFMHKIANRQTTLRTGESGRHQTPESRMKRSHWIVLLIMCLLVGLLVFKTVLHMINTDTKKARIIHAPTPVETVPVRRQTLEEVIGGSGMVEQFNTVLLTTQISARVLEVPVKIGDIVKKGDLLARWDDRLIQATLEANRQFVETSNIKIKGETRQVERYTTLEKKHMGTPLDLEKAEIALADAREELAKATLGLRQAEIGLEHVQMRSPIDGIVLERLVNPDETTHNDQVVIKLGALETVLMAAKVTEEKIHSVQLGLSAEISFPAFPAETFQGKVFKTDPNIDPVTRTFTSYVEINNPDLRLKPGLSGFARIHRTAKDVLAVPSVAIINPSGDQASVFVVDNSGHANLRKVGLGIVVNAMTEVTGGLKEGEKVVTVGQLYLQENDKVHSTAKSNIAK